MTREALAWAALIVLASLDACRLCRCTEIATHVWSAWAPVYVEQLGLALVVV